MTTPLIIRYPLDPTGVSSDNLILNEEHTLSNRKTRAVAPLYGAFFKESMTITDMSTGTVLTSDQFKCVELYELPSCRYGKEIYAIVLITDSSVGSSIQMTYQCLGGEYGTSATAIIQQIDTLNLDNRPVNWPDLIGIPDEFTPAKHLHDAGDIYGFEYVVNALDRVRAAIELGDAASHDAILTYIDNVEALMLDANNATLGKLNTHLADLSNPHKVTPSQIGAYSTVQVDALVMGVQNSLISHLNDKNNPHATTAAQVGAYTTTQVDSLIATATAAMSVALNAHISNLNNPHGTTAAQVGAYTKAQVDAAIAASQGTMTAALAAHASNTSNPHQTTAAQVGAYTTAQVDAAIAASQGTLSASLTAHINNTTNPHHVTAAQVGAYTTTQVDALIANVMNTTGAQLTAHLADTTNPHQVTAAQVGAYTKAQVDAAIAAATGSSNASLTAHIANTSNPHMTTAAQVGAYTTAQVDALLAGKGSLAATNAWTKQQQVWGGLNLPVSSTTIGAGWFIEAGLVANVPALRFRFNGTNPATGLSVSKVVAQFLLDTSFAITCGDLLNDNDIVGFDDVVTLSSTMVMA